MFDRLDWIDTEWIATDETGRIRGSVERYPDGFRGYHYKDKGDRGTVKYDIGPTPFPTLELAKAAVAERLKQDAARTA